MFQLMRNIHLGLGLALFVMALMFELSSLFVVYRGWFPDEVTDTEGRCKSLPRWRLHRARWRWSGGTAAFESTASGRP